MSDINGNGARGNRNIKGLLFGAESAGFFGAEIAAEATWLGVALVAELIPQSIMHKVAGTIGKVCIEPFLDPIERGLSTVCKLKECKPDLSKSREERAEALARTILIYAPAIWASLQTKIHARRYFNKNIPSFLGVYEEDFKKDDVMVPWGQQNIFNKAYSLILGSDTTPQERMIITADEIPHIGSMIAMNTGMAAITDDLIQTLSEIAHKTTGMQKSKTLELATAVCAYGLPNTIGALGGGMAIAGKHFLDWPNGLIGQLFQRSRT